MKDMERESFENEWKNAFKQAEISPSDNLWTSIELDLERAEGEKMKRKLLHYKLMVAASVTFALCFAGIGFYYFRSGQDYAQRELAINATVNNELSSEQITSQNSKDHSQNQGFSLYEIQQKPENLINEIEKDGLTNQDKESLPSSASKEPEKGRSKIYKIESKDDTNIANRSMSSEKNDVATLITKAKLVTSKEKASSSDQQSVTNDENGLTAGSITNKERTVTVADCSG